MQLKKIVLFSAFFVSFTHEVIAQPPATKPIFVLVHGAWGGSWAFKKVDSLLTAKGCTVYRQCLTGQGERSNLSSPQIGLKVHIADVVNTILYENLHDVVLVGHSYGGMVVTGVADSIPDRIKKVIYVDAFLPDSGDNALHLLGKDSSMILSMAKDGFMVPFWVQPNAPLPHDVPQSLKTFTDPISLKHPSPAVAATYILTVDAGKSPDQDQFASQAARAKKKGIQVLQLTADHNPQWSNPVEFANMLYDNR